MKAIGKVDGMIEAMPITKKLKQTQTLPEEPEPEKEPVLEKKEEEYSAISVAPDEIAPGEGSSGEGFESIESDIHKRDQRNFSFLAVPPPRWRGTINEDGAPVVETNYQENDVRFERDPKTRHELDY